MGVRGLTTFIANRSHLYLENYKLHNTYLVLDGNNIASQLYKWHCKCNDCFGGDYDKYAQTIRTFFKLLLDANVTPLVILDGGYEKRKLKTVYLRMQNRIDTVKKMTSITQGNGDLSVFPLFLRELFLDLLAELRVKCVRCDFEADNEMACIARRLQCPVLSYDSDFYIFDVLYIPFSTMELKLCKLPDNSGSYIPCQVYRVEKFLNSFGGVNKINLPILAALLGNDYIKTGNFSSFYSQLKLTKGWKDQNDQQRRIKTVMLWLKNETPESAIDKILGRFKLQKRRVLERRMRSIIEGYECVDSIYLKYLKIDSNVIQRINPVTDPSITSSEELMDMSEDNADESMDEAQDELTESSDDDSENSPIKIAKDFQENFRNVLYPSFFMDILTINTYYFITQVEDYTQQHSHTISLRILSAIYQILTHPNKRQLSYIARDENAKIKKYLLPGYPIQLPTLKDIENFPQNSTKKIILNILGISEDFMEFLGDFPTNWSLILISIKYWMMNSKVELIFVYSIILCGIYLNYADKYLEFCRSSKAFAAKYGGITSSTQTLQTTIRDSLGQIDFNDSVNCLKELIHYFQMNEKMKTQFKLFNRKVIHLLAEFQSCLLHIKYLNCLFGFPFDNFLISDFYDGTFIYNMIVNLRKRTNVEMYLKLLLKDCPTVLNSLELIMKKVVENIVDISQAVPKKRRKRPKKTKRIDVEEESVNGEQSEDEGVVDPNNRFALLSVA